MELKETELYTCTVSRIFILCNLNNYECCCRFVNFIARKDLKNVMKALPNFSNGKKLGLSLRLHPDMLDQIEEDKKHAGIVYIRCCQNG